MPRRMPRAGVVKLYRAYREQASRLSDLTVLMAGEGQAPAAGARLPSDEVRDVLERRSAYFGTLEEAAEAFRAVLPAGELVQVLKDWLQKERGISVRILPVHVMPDLRRRFDRHSMRLFISERLAACDQLQEIAVEVATLTLREAISRELETLSLSTPEAARIARFELARYAALALMMPYGAVLSAAKAIALRHRYSLRTFRMFIRTSRDAADDAAAARRMPAFPSF